MLNKTQPSVLRASARFQTHGQLSSKQLDVLMVFPPKLVHQCSGVVPLRAACGQCGQRQQSRAVGAALMDGLEEARGGACSRVLASVGLPRGAPQPFEQDFLGLD